MLVENEEIRIVEKKDCNETEEKVKDIMSDPSISIEDKTAFTEVMQGMKDKSDSDNCDYESCDDTRNTQAHECLQVGRGIRKKRGCQYKASESYYNHS